MEQKIFDAVLAELRPALEDQGFSEKDGVFTSDKRSFKIDYDEEKQLFLLLSAEVADGQPGEYTVASSYLFDSTQNANDAASVGMDFTDTAASLLGTSTRKMRTANAVALPTKGDGNSADIGELCNKLLAIFPAYKDLYKERVAEDGEFLYVQFMLDTFAKEIRALLEADSGKKLKKIYDSLNDLFIKGDRNVGNTIIVVVLGGATKGDRALSEKLVASLTDFPYLKKGVRTICERAQKDKKLREIYGL